MILSARHIRSFSGLLFISLIVILTFATPSSAQAANEREKPVKTVAVLHCDYSPVSFMDKNTNRPSGFLADIMNSVAVRAGLNMEHICKSGWQEIITAIESGEADAGVLLKSEARQKAMLFSAPIEVTYLSFFARSEASVDPDKMPAGLTVGVVKGGLSYQLPKNRAGLAVQTDGTYQEGLFRLLAGQIALFAGEDPMIMRSAGEAGLGDRIKKAGKSFVELERCLVVRKNNAQLLERLNTSLYGFIGSPEYQRIYLKWFGPPAPFWTIRTLLIACAGFLLLAVGGMAFWRYLALSRINAERRQAQQALQESRTRFQAIFEQSNDGIAVADIDGRYVMANPAFCSMTGYRQEELVHMRVHDLVPDHVKMDLFPGVAGLKRSGRREVELLKKDGSLFVASISGTVLQIGSRQYALGIHQDITEHKQADAVIKEKNAQLQTLIHAMPDMVIFKDVEGRHLIVNKTAEKLTGLTEAELAGKTNEELLPPDLAQMCRKGDEEAMRSPEPVHSEEFMHHEGRTIYLDTIKAPIYDDQGRLKGLVAVGRDATRRKLAEIELKESIKRAENERSRAEAIIAAIGEGISIRDTGYRLVYQNQVNVDNVGNHVGELCYKAFYGLDDICSDCPVEKTFQDGNIHKSEKAVSTERGLFYFESTASPVRDTTGKIIAGIELIRDVTANKRLHEQLETLNKNLADRVLEEIEKNRAKEQLIQLQSRHAAMGEMINNIAHQWRQPLNNLGLTVQGIQARFEAGRLNPETLRDKVRLSMFLINYMSQTINDFTNFFRQDKSVSKFRLREVVDIATGFMETGLKRNAIDVHIDVPDDIAVTGYKNEYTQVVVNILTNARDVLVERRTIKPRIKLNAFRDNAFAVLAIADNGGGIPEAIIDKIFAPYFTTKEPGKGTGIGLYISKTIIENNMSGKLSVSNNTDGAEFRIEVRE